MHKYFCLTIFFLLFASLISFAQTGISEPEVIPALNHDLSIPLREMDEMPIMQTPWVDGIIPLRNRSTMINDDYETDPVLQLANGNQAIANILENFDGVGAQGFAPPDVSGDVGPNHYMQMVNVRFQIWDKNGNSLLGPSNLGTIWAGFPGPWASSLNDGDPVVLYDDMADRWVATQFSLPNNGNGPEYLLVAVSQTPDPTGAWYRYGFETAQFPDYPKFGVWSDGYYFSANRFAGGFVGCYAGALERDKMLIGDPANMVIFSVSSSISWSLLPADCDGTTPPPAGAPNYFMQSHDNAFYGGSDGIDIFEFDVDWATPSNSTFTGPTFYATSPFSMVNGIPQQGTSTQLDDLSDRPMQRLQYRNFGSHESMVVCQTINASGRAGMRWYELRNTGSWSLYQEGTYAPADNIHRWMGSISMNASGDIALGYSASSTTMFPDIRFTGRNDGDPLGIMTATEEVIYSSSGSQNGLTRWGDYTQMAVDPDGQTFWYTGEYQPFSGSFNWRTRIAEFSFGAACPIDPATNPNPADGAIDVSINLPEISWTNGAGATMVEVWFGKVGNVTMVYDGALISSWSIPSTLDYNTNYNWRIVGKNDTCSVPSPTIWGFSTEHDQSNAIIFEDNFDSYTAGLQLACQNPVDWTTWSLTPCGSDDAFVSNAQASSSPNSVNIVLNNDQLKLFPSRYTNGKYSMSWDMYIATGFTGYFNCLSSWNNGSPQWAMQVYFNQNGQGNMDAGGALAQAFTYPHDTWMDVEVICDLDSDIGEFWLNGVMIYTWVWSTGTFGTGELSLEANNFYGGGTDGVPDYYFDNYMVVDLLVIPVELTSFTAVDENGQVKLNWTTATELNNQMFEIQRRSSEGEYITIGYVDGYGTTTEPQEYSFVDNSALTGKFFYRLKQFDFGGRYEYSDEIEIEVTGPLAFKLEQNYPNPFNPSTLIKYSIPESGLVTLEVYNLLGEKISTLVNGVQQAGRYEVNFDASNLASGIYVYSLRAGSFNLVKKMLLMK
jgi:hypothetical protein